VAWGPANRHNPFALLKIAMHLERAAVATMMRPAFWTKARTAQNGLKKDDEPKMVNEKLMPSRCQDLTSQCVSWGAFASKPPRAALRSGSSPRLIGVPISFRTSPDVRAIQDVLTPFIDLDDGDTHRDDEGEKYDCLDDHFLNRQYKRIAVSSS
jgi:hypothetical protein